MMPALPPALAVAGLASSVTVGLIFLSAGVEKWRHRSVLPGVIANYRLLPDSLVAPAAMLLPLVEIATGAGLIAGFAPLPVVMAIALLIAFATAMAINVGRGRSHIDCGCGGPALRQPLSRMLVARNLLLATILLPRLLPSAPLAGIDLFTAGAAGLGAFLVYFLFQSLGALFASQRPVASRR